MEFPKIVPSSFLISRIFYIFCIQSIGKKLTCSFPRIFPYFKQNYCLGLKFNSALIRNAWLTHFFSEVWGWRWATYWIGSLPRSKWESWWSVSMPLVKRQFCTSSSSVKSSLPSLQSVRRSWWLSNKVTLRLQRRNRRVQKHLLHRLGRRWTRQDPTSLETLLPKYSGKTTTSWSALTNFKGLIFVVDSSDRERIQESHDELHKMVFNYLKGLTIYNLLSSTKMN